MKNMYSSKYRLDKLRRTLSLVLCVLFALTQFPMPARADGGRLAAFNEELMDDQLNWGIAGGGSASSGSITLNAASAEEPSEGRYEIDLSPLYDAVEAGGLRADISYSASPQGATVTFVAGGSSLSDGDVVPAGSTTVLVTVLNPTSEAAEFTLSFAFNDTDVPTLSAEVSPETWTNGDVLITPAADDADSGVKNVFESDQDGAPLTSLADNGDGTYTASANGIYYFTAEDFASHSATISCTVVNIDKEAPTNPSISLSSEDEWATSSVTATITGDAAPDGESPQAVEYAVNGGAFSAYTGMLTLSDEGATQLGARVRDQAGNVSDTVEKTVQIDTQAPDISASFGNTGTDNKATLTFTASDTASGVLEKRYLEGERTAADYASATVLAGDSVALSAGHYYTVFAKDNAGHIGSETLYASSVPSLTLPGSFSINESETKTLSFSVSDSETADGSLAVTVDSADSAALSAGVVQNSGGTVSVPLTAADDVQSERTVNLTITVTDGDNQQSSGVLAVSLVPVNDAPQATNDEATVSEDGNVLVSVLDNDTDEEDDTLSISAVGEPAHGTAVIAGSSVRYTPNANYNGSDSFTYTVYDGDKTSIGVVAVTVTGVADAPVAVDGVLVIQEDTPVDIDLLGSQYVTDADLSTAQGDVLSITAVDTATYTTVGTVTILNAEGDAAAQGETGVAVRYEPASEYSGTDKFRFTITDSYGLSTTAVFSVKVNAVNDLPEYHSLNNLYEIDEDSGTYTLSFTVSDQETPADSLMLQAASMDDDIIPDSTLSLEKDGDGLVSLSFAPALNQNGDAVIKFTLGDGFQSVEKLVTIRVNPINDTPIAVNDTISYTEDTARVIDPAVLLNNDSDIESGKPTFIAIEDWPDSAGTLLQTGDTYLFTPAANYAENFTFRYLVRDADGAEARATVTMRATAVNDTPTISAAVSSLTIDEDTASAPITFTIHDQESLASALTVTAGSDNNALISPDGIDLTTVGEERTITLTPNPDQFGTATITLTVSDGLTSSTAVIELTVSGVQDTPAAVNDTIAALRTGDTNFTSASLLANDSDPDGDTLALSEYTQPAFGSLTLVNGIFTYQVNTDIPDTQATDSFQYTISDGHENTATATVTINLTGESAAPVITSIADQYLLEDFEQTSVTFHVSDPDGTAPSVQVSENPEGIATITLTPGENGAYTLTLTSILNQYGDSQITVTATDGAGKTASTQFKLTVYPVNDAPVAGNVELSVQEDIAKSFSLIDLAGESISDVENDTLSVVSITPDNASTKGRLYSLGGGSYQYDPNTNVCNVSETYTYVISDGKDETAGTLTVTITPVNDAPWFHQAIYKNVPNEMDEQATIDVVAYARDVDDSSFYIDSFADANYGTVTVADNKIVYTRTSTPEGGADSFTVTVRDKENTDPAFNLTTAPEGYRTATVTVNIGLYSGYTVWAYNTAYETDEDADPFTFNLDCGLSEGLEYNITLGANNAAIGTASVNSAQKTVTYTPQPDANGTDSFQYTITTTIDSVETSRTAWVYVTLRPVNDAPVFVVAPDQGSTSSINEDTTLSDIPISIADVDGDELTLNAYAVNANPEQPVLLPSGIQLVKVESDYALTLTPVANANGNVTVTLAVSDGVISTQRSFTLHVEPVNDAPVAQDYTFHIQEDTPAAFTLVDANSDVDDAASTLTLQCTDPAHGSLSVSGDGVVYTPAANYFGNDSFTYTITDPHNSASSPATVSIVVGNVNDPPRISGLSPSVVMLEDATASTPFTVLDDDTEDTHNASVSLESESVAGLFPEGSLNIVGGTITLAPGADKYGTAVIRLTVTDSELAEATQTVAVTVLPVNDLPVAADDSATLEEDASVEIEVTANDTDAEDAAGSLRILDVNTTNAHGTVTVSDDKHSFTYTPNSNYNQAASVTYRVVDSNNGYSNWATVTFTITPVNDAPVANADTAATTEDFSTTINVLSNDSDAEGSALTIITPTTEESVVTTKGGTAILTDGKILYTPAADFFGKDTFTYTISDGELTGTGTVTVTVNAVNDPPTIVNITPFTHDVSDGADCWMMDEDETKIFQFDASDAYNETPPQSLIVKVTSDNQLLLPDASIAYSGSTTVKSVAIKPAANAYGDVNLTVTANDGVNTTTAVFLLRVRPVNDTPVLTSDDSIELDEDTSYAGTCSAYDVEHSDVCYTISAEPAHGSVSIGAYSGNYTYTPDENYYGPDSFTIRACDEDINNYDEVAVAVTVNPVNDLPTAVGETDTTAEDTAITFTFDTLLANDSDLETDPSLLTISAAGSAVNGTVALDSGAKTVTFTPAENYYGAGSFTYTVRDGDNGTATATVDITITAVNDIPAALSQTVSIGENAGATAIPMSTLASDVEGDALSVSSASWQEPDTFGVSFSITDGQLTVTPNANWTQSENQTLHLNYTVEETATPENAASGTLNVTLVAVNDAPVITIVTEGNPALTFDEDSAGGMIEFAVSDEEDDVSILTVTAAGTKINTTALNTELSDDTTANRTAQVTSLLNQNGATTVTLTVKDSKDATDQAAFNVSITPVNDNPVAVTDSVDIKENDGKTAIAIAKLATDVDGDALVALSASWDEAEYYNATVSVEEGVLYITPDANWTEAVSHTLHVSYTVGESATTEEYFVSGTLTVNLIPENDAPVITIHTPSLSFNEDEATEALNTVSFSVSDEEDDATDLTVAASGGADIIDIPALNTALSGGTTADRTALVTSLLDANGLATVTLTVTDSNDATGSGTFSADVIPVNDAPRLETDPVFSIEEDDGKTAVPFDTLILDVEDNMVEVVGSSVTSTDDTFGAIFSVEGGMLYITPDANWTYTETKTFHLKYKIAETVTEEHYTSEEGTLTVNLLPVNDAPVISAIADQEMEEKTSQVIRFTVTDEDDSPSVLTVTYNSTVPSLHKPIVITTDAEDATGNTRIFTLETTRFYGVSTITISAKDDAEKAAVPEAFKLTVGWSNDDPVAADDTYSLNEDGSLLMDVLQNDTDDDVGIGGAYAQTLSILAGSVSAPQHGTAVIQNREILYTPAADYFGPDSFTYSATDGYAGSNPSSATVSVTVNPVNDAPVAVNDTASTPEDTALEIVTATLIANDTDIEGDTISFTAAQSTAGTNGTVSYNSETGIVTYAPVLNYHGAANFTYTISDGNGGTATGTVNITVSSVNDAPEAVDDSVTVSEDDVGVTLTVLANDSDVDGDTLTITGVTQPARGEVLIADGGGALTYTPVLNDHGVVSCTYTISDGNGGMDTASVTITIDAVNDAPVAANDTAAMAEDDPQTSIDVLANDTDVDGDTLTVTAVSSVQHGTAQIAPGGTAVLFTPVADFHGDASFTYTVSDGGGGTDSADVVITVASVNDAPVANEDTFSLAEDSEAVTVDVLDNDTDVDGDTLTVTGVSAVQHGEAAILPDGSGVTFLPDADYFGVASFSYTISDGNGGTDTATASGTVTPVNDAPVAVDDEPEVTAEEDTPVVIPFGTLLANDTDVDTAHASLVVSSYNGAAHGNVSMDTDGGTFTFTPSENYNGPASFQYLISDGSLPSNYATVRFTISAVNDAPSPADDTASTSEDTPITIDVLANDTDTEGDALTVTAVTSPAHGTAAVNEEENALDVTPDFNYNGLLTFTYTVSDGNGGTATANVTVTVTPVNDAPVASNDSLSTAEDTPLMFQGSVLLANDTDVDGDTIQISSIQAGGLAHGTVVFEAATDTITYTPAPNYHGEASFTYTVTDGNGGTASATAQITVTPVDDAPVAVDDTASVKAGSTVNVNVLFNDSDQGDGDTLIVKTTLAAEPAHGTVVVNPDGTISYKAASSYKGEDTFAYVLTDGTGEAQATVTVTVTASSSSSDDDDDIIVVTPRPTTITTIPTPAPVYTPRKESTTPVVTPAPEASTAPMPTQSQDVKLFTDEKPMESGEWSNSPVNLTVTDENGQPDTILYRLKGETEWKTLPVGEQLTFDETGEYTVEYRTGNDKDVKEKVVLVDLLPPAVPEITTTDDGGSTQISFNFLSDPGNSGNEYLILPDGEKIPLSAGFTYNAPKDGIYTFTLMDRAGNTTTFAVPVHASINAGSVSISPGYPYTGQVIAAGSAGLLLFLLLFRRPVKIIYEGVDGKGKKYRAVRKRFARIPKKEETLTLELKPPQKAQDAKELTVRFTRPFTRLMRERHVELTLDDKRLDEFFIEKDQKGQWEVTVLR